ELRAGLEEYLELLSYLRPAMLALAQNPVMTLESGYFQPHVRRQPHYTHHSRLVLPIPRKELMHPRRELSHPRIDLTHPQRPYADMVAEKEHDLLNLPTY